MFTWESGGDPSTAYMHDISFEARPGTLTMVVGSVASGKTSLLSALIGQMERLQGTVAVGGRVAYVAQTAWIINDSVQVRVWVCGMPLRHGGGSGPCQHLCEADAMALDRRLICFQEAGGVLLLHGFGCHVDDAGMPCVVFFCCCSPGEHRHGRRL